MAEQEPTVADLPIEVRGDVDKLQKKVERAQREVKKAETELARRAAFGAFDVTVPNEGEVNYQQYLDARPGMPEEGLVRRNGGMIQDVVTGKPASREAYHAQQAKETSRDDYYYEQQEVQAIKSQKLQGVTAYAREASAARLAGDSVREEKLRTLVQQYVSETIAKDEMFTKVDREARQAEEMARYDELVATMPERLKEVERRRAERENKHATEIHKKPRGEGQPSNRQTKAETDASINANVETYLGDELVEVKNSFTSADGETIVEIIGADGKSSFVRKGELTEKEIETPNANNRSEAGEALSAILKDAAVDKLQRKLQGDGSEDEPDADAEADSPKPEKKDKKDKVKKKDESAPKEDTPKEVVEKPKKFIPGSFHGSKRVSLTGWSQKGGGKEIVEVEDEEGNRYKIPGDDLRYRTTPPEDEPKAPGKEVELYSGPSDAEVIAEHGSLDHKDSNTPTIPGKEVELFTGDKSSDSEPQRAPRFAVGSDGEVTDENSEYGFLAEHVVEVEAKERKSVKEWWANFGHGVREKAGSGFFASRWGKSARLDRDINETTTPEAAQEKREGNRYKWMAAGIGVTVVGLIVAGGAVLASSNAPAEKAPTSIDLGEHLEWTKQNPGMGRPLPSESPSPSVENLPLTGIDGTGPQEITP